jgi:hypothetical protein
MGANQSQNRSQEEEDRFRREGEEMERKEREEERVRAEEAARKAEEDRKRQEEENRRIEAARLKREAEERKRAEEEAAYIKANTPFQKPTAPTLSLTNKLSKPCLNCDIVIPPGLSSSTVILSRDIIGKQPKLIPPPKEIPPGKYAGTYWEKYYKKNYLVPTSFTYQDGNTTHFNLASLVPWYKENSTTIDLGTDLADGGQGFKYVLKDTWIRTIEGTDRKDWKNIPTFKCAFPNKKFPEVLVDGRPETKEIKTFEDAYKLIDEQNAELDANIAKLNNTELGIMLWNPSETKGDKGSVAVNYKTHGALTKVFLKPTIPFSITYGIGADVEKAERKEKERLKKLKEAEEAKKKKEEEAKKAEGK